MAKKKKEEPILIEEKPIILNQLKCRNAKQKFFLQQMRNYDITIVDGSAGSGKTYIALYEGVYNLMSKKCEKIILCKSVISTPDQDLGFIPGDLNEKMEPHIMSYKGNLSKMMPEEQVTRLFNEKKIEVLPLAFIRGVTIDNSFIIIDEVQNISMELFKSIITRIGENSKMVFLGDVEQVDFDKDKKRKQSALQYIIDIFKNEDYVGLVHFEDEDVVRNPIIPKILKKLRDFK